MRVAVTGGSGFIGSHVVDILIDNGHDVVVIDRLPPQREDVEFAHVDILDLHAVVEATWGCGIIFHLAAVSNVNTAFNDPISTTKVNIVGTNNILEAVRQNRAQRFILASTVWVYAGAHGKWSLTEEEPFYLPDIGHIYVSSKIGAEILCHTYWHLYQVPFTILRYGIPYGPRMREELLIPSLIRKALRGDPLTITGDGTQSRNFLYVEDLAAAHLLVMSERAENQTYNVEGARKITVRHVAETIRQILGEPLDIVYTAARPGDYPGKEVSSAKIRRELGWWPQVEFEEGLQRTLSWFQRTRTVHTSHQEVLV